MTYRSPDWTTLFTRLVAVATGCALLMLASEPALAQAAGGLLTPVDNILSQLVQALQGTIARSLAIIAVCFFGYRALFGHMSWYLAGTIIGGIVLIFGAATIVDAVKGAAG